MGGIHPQFLCSATGIKGLPRLSTPITSCTWTTNISSFSAGVHSKGPWGWEVALVHSQNTSSAIFCCNCCLVVHPQYSLDHQVKQDSTSLYWSLDHQTVYWSGCCPIDPLIDSMRIVPPSTYLNLSLFPAVLSWFPFSYVLDHELIEYFQSWQAGWVIRRLLLRGVTIRAPFWYLPLCVLFVSTCVCLFSSRLGGAVSWFLPLPYLHSCCSLSWFLPVKRHLLPLPHVWRQIIEKPKSWYQSGPTMCLTSDFYKPSLNCALLSAAFPASPATAFHFVTPMSSSIIVCSCSQPPFL